MLHFNARAVYQKYYGAFDGRPVDLNPLSPAAEGERYLKAGRRAAGAGAGPRGGGAGRPAMGGDAAQSRGLCRRPGARTPGRCSARFTATWPIAPRADRAQHLPRRRAGTRRRCQVLPAPVAGTPSWPRPCRSRTGWTPTPSASTRSVRGEAFPAAATARRQRAGIGRANRICADRRRAAGAADVTVTATREALEGG